MDKQSIKHMKFLLSLFCLLAGSCLQAKPLKISVAAESAILMNADTGAVLYEKQAKKQQIPASTTKIATVMYALKVYGNNLDEILIPDFESIASLKSEDLRKANYTPAYRLVPGGTHMGIKKGEELSRRDILHGIMLISANDGANVIAKDVGGTIPEFMKHLNDYLKGIGCNDTLYKNPHGLYHPEHYTTAYDLALMTKEALKNPQFCEIVKTVRYTRPKTNIQEASPLVNSNKLLRSGKYHYPKAIGVKTGYLTLSKNTFVAAAESEGRRLIAVLLKCDERDDAFRDAKLMFETAFSEKKIRKTLLNAGPQEASLTIKGALKPIKTYLKEDVSVEYYPAEETHIQCFLEWNTEALPVLKDQKVGQLTFKDSQGKTLFVRPLLALENVSESWIKKHPLMIMVAFGGLVLIVFLFLKRR